MKTRQVVGIDLGTTRSVVGRIDEHGRGEVLPNAECERLTPSVVLFEPQHGEGGAPHEVIVGTLARDSAIVDGTRVVQFVKREMGRAGPSFDFDGISYSAEEISAFILTKLKLDAQSRLGCEIEGAVITVPAYFNDVQRKATEDAARLAGFEVLGVLNEPVAAALAHGLLRPGEKSGEKAETNLVFDLGGGTFDITVMADEGGGQVRMLATDGDDALGGKDWDDRLITHVAGIFEEEFGVDPLEDLTAYQDLAARCEAAKIALSRKETVRIAFGYAGHSTTVELTRGRFEELTADLLARAEAKVELVLEESGKRFEDLDGILLVGGATRMPLVRESLMRRCPRARFLEGAHPDEAVALGAAIEAELQQARRDGVEPPSIGGVEGGDLGGLRVGSVNAHSLGVVARAGGEFRNCILIPRNTPLPTMRQGRFQTFQDDQTRVEVVILEGEETDPDRCAQIGTCVIEGLPPRPRGAPVTIEYAYDARGRILVRALDEETGREAKTTIEREGGLTEELFEGAQGRVAGAVVS